MSFRLSAHNSPSLPAYSIQTKCTRRAKDGTKSWPFNDVLLIHPIEDMTATAEQHKSQCHCSAPPNNRPHPVCSAGPQEQARAPFLSWNYMLLKHLIVQLNACKPYGGKNERKSFSLVLGKFLDLTLKAQSRRWESNVLDFTSKYQTRGKHFQTTHPT